MAQPATAAERRLAPLPALVFSSRWLQLPLYLGLIVAQGVYVVLFVKELIHLIGGALALNEQQVMLIVLALIDVVMISNLLVMVIVGGYETFVSRLNLKDHPDQPEWLSHVNAGILKVKLATALIGRALWTDSVCMGARCSVGSMVTSIPTSTTGRTCSPVPTAAARWTASARTCASGSRTCTDGIATSAASRGTGSWRTWRRSRSRAPRSGNGSGTRRGSTTDRSSRPRSCIGSSRRRARGSNARSATSRPRARTRSGSSRKRGSGRS